MYDIYLYYDCSLPLLLVTGIVLMQLSLHSHSEYWTHPHSAAQMELTWVQNGPVVFEKAQLTKKDNTITA